MSWPGSNPPGPWATGVIMGGCVMGGRLAAGPTDQHRRHPRRHPRPAHRRPVTGGS
jgi:hypothetical protein